MSLHVPQCPTPMTKLISDIDAQDLDLSSLEAEINHNALLLLYSVIMAVCITESNLFNTIYSQLKYSIVHIVDVNADLIWAKLDQ